MIETRPKVQPDVVAVGSIYAEFHLDNFPFTEGIKADDRLVGGMYRVIAGSSALYFAGMCQILGLRAAFIGKTGDDSAGRMLDELLENSGITSALAKSPKCQTNIGIIPVNDQGETITIVAGNANPTLDREDVSTKLSSLLPGAKYVYFGGCFRMKKLIPDYPELTAMARRQNVLVAMDHGPVSNNSTQDEVLKIRMAVTDVNFYFPSRQELLQTWEVKTVEDGLRKVADNSQAQIVLKDKSQGAWTIQNGQIVRIPAYPIDKVVNPVGGGDSFNAAVIYAHSQRMSLLESIRFGCAAAAVRITQITPPTLESIQKLFQNS